MTRDEVLAKVRKLLALSGSANEHEAALALARAQALLAKYSLTLRDVDATKAEILHVVVPDWWQLDDRRQFADHLIAVLGKYTGCVAMLRLTGMWLAGASANLDVASLLLAFLFDVAQRAAQQAWLARNEDLTDPILGRHPVLDEPFARRTFIHGFLFGFIDRLAHRLAKSVRVDTPEATAPALVHVGHTLIRQHDALMTHLISRGMKAPEPLGLRAKIDRAGMDAGAEAGDAVPLSPPKGYVE